MLTQGVDIEKVVKLLETLEIEDKVTGNIIPWRLSNLQRLALERSWGKKKVTIAKSRQVGLSTLVCAMDVLWVVEVIRKGNRNKCAIILDTEDKSMGRLYQCRDFADQLELPNRLKGNRLVFPGGAEIVALTAGGKRAGSSFSYTRYHLSEMPYWGNDAIRIWGSIKAALSDEGECIAESTFDITNELPRALWYGKHKFHNVFLSVEDEPRFRYDPDAITDEQWEWMQTEGYTDRSAASWFINIGIEEESLGDSAQAFRQFPQVPEHMFRAAANRWVMHDPEVVAPIRTAPAPGLNEMFHVEIFEDPNEQDIAIGVDTASGRGRDSSVVVAIDRRTLKLLAAFESNKIIVPDLIQVMSHVWEMYRKPGEIFLGKSVGDEAPAILIEGGGIGDASQQQAQERGIPHTRFPQTDATKYRCLALAKEYIEKGVIFGPQRLADECQELRIDELNKKRFLGKKDMVMAIGMTLSHIKDNPLPEKKAPVPRDTRVINMRATIRQERRIKSQGRF